MPINPINFSPLQTVDPLAGFFQGIEDKQRMQEIIRQRLANQQTQSVLPFAGQMAAANLFKLQNENKFAPQMSEAELKKQQLANQLSEAGLPFAQEMAKANTMYKEAMARYLTSPAKQVQGLTPLGKSFLEPYILDKVTGNPVPNPNYNPNSDMQPTGNEVTDRYNLYRQKLTTDATARQKNLFASNIEKTLSFIDPDDLTQYAGIRGHLKKFEHQGLASAGNQPPEYNRYLRSLNASKLLATQVRQFYGDSIQPDMIMRLENLTNPSTWMNNPELAKEQFSQTKNILKQETGTYRQAMKSTKPYEEQPEQKSQQGANIVEWKRVNGKLVRS